jgi:UDP-N-acetylmuramoyl-L-alanyl-D-glutamate--2,6-diaminopimelate ligase
MQEIQSLAPTTLQRLLGGFDVLRTTGPQDPEIHGIAYHSASVGPRYLFVAISGNNQDGHRFLSEAIRRGAVAAVVERIQDDLPSGFTQVQVANGRIALANLANALYDHPTNQLALVGITGTNGKTTTAHILEAILHAAGHRVGMLGTIYYRYGQRTLPAPNTTPESLDLQRILREMVEAGITHALMEVTSHALDQHRVLGCAFRGALFTNLTRDHLDYHKDMAAYLSAKVRLFSEHLLPKAKGGWAVLNADDPASGEIQRQCKGRILWYGQAPEAHFRPLNWELGPDGTRILIQHPDGELALQTKLLGQPNVLNTVAACACAWAMGIDPNSWRDGLESLAGVSGRFEAVENSRGITVVVDYAHTPDALERALQSARGLTKGRLICVFGCGGDRDRGKRPMMARATAQHSDLVVVTSDNPRGERPLSIIQEILLGFEGLPIRLSSLDEGDGQRPLPAYGVIEDRTEAIKRAVALAQPGDFVLIAGKGHETYQIIGTRRIAFDDREVARAAMAEVGS